MATAHELVKMQRTYFRSGATRRLGDRVRALEALREAILDHERDIYAALRADLNKTEFEAYTTEVGIVLEEIRTTLRHVSRWARPQRKSTPLAHFPSWSRVLSEPYGTVLIMAPWNYPFQLVMNPLVGAIAAGNTCVLKPSAYAPATAAIVGAIVREVFDPAHVTVVQGGREANQTLLHELFDLIFFTGSPAVGKVVMAAAAERLTPVVLELGGKSPCIVDASANVRLAARRLAWGKLLNAGQTCVAPDYVLAHESVAEGLVEELRRAISKMFGENPLANPDYPKIVNEKHFERLRGLLTCGNIAFGGQVDASSTRIAPTVLTGVGRDDPVMQEEIFGPILPVLTFSTIGEVCDLLAERPKPLALYLFTRDHAVKKTVLERVSFGGGCVNDTIIHLANPALPFGGVGLSGMGRYHGEYSFQTFSHQKGIVKKSNLIDVPLRYAPYRTGKLPLIKLLLG